MCFAWRACAARLGLTTHKLVLALATPKLVIPSTEDKLMTVVDCSGLEWFASKNEDSHNLFYAISYDDGTVIVTPCNGESLTVVSADQGSTSKGPVKVALGAPDCSAYPTGLGHLCYVGLSDGTVQVYHCGSSTVLLHSLVSENETMVVAVGGNEGVPSTTCCTHDLATTTTTTTTTTCGPVALHLHSTKPQALCCLAAVVNKTFDLTVYAGSQKGRYWCFQLNNGFSPDAGSSPSTPAHFAVSKAEDCTPAFPVGLVPNSHESFVFAVDK
eukprot:gene3097-603_t